METAYEMFSFSLVILLVFPNEAPNIIIIVLITLIIYKNKRRGESSTSLLLSETESDIL